MKLLSNVYFSMRFTLTLFLVLGIWGPDYNGIKKYLYNFYSFFSFMFILGIYDIVQIADLIQVWGNLSLMTATVFLLFTNLATSIKVLNVILRRKTIEAMIKESDDELSHESREIGRNIIRNCDKQSARHLLVFFILSYTTIAGWALSADKNELPLRAWYPYDTTKSPAYELTFAYQCVGVLLAAAIGICLHTLVTSMISQCVCRLRLLVLSLRTLCDGLDISNEGLLSESSNEVVAERLKQCIVRHQTILAQTKVIQECFSAPIFAQFCVSLNIICVTAYQLAFESSNAVRIVSMLAYLLVMVQQVFFYCYQGNELVVQSEEVSTAAYESPWYTCNISVRRTLLNVMTRTQQEARLTAAGVTELSLVTFMSIIKASYTFFTVLQQTIEET